jgi:hypothetical protein
MRYTKFRDEYFVRTLRNLVSHVYRNDEFPDLFACTSVTKGVKLLHQM